MADIVITRPHAASPERLRALLGRVADDASLYGLFSEWKTPDRLLLTGKGVEAWVLVAPASLEVRVALPWLFRLIRGVIETEVTEKVEGLLAEAAREPVPPEA